MWRWTVCISDNGTIRCTCKDYAEFYLPCVHSIRALLHDSKDPYSEKAWLNVYFQEIHINTYSHGAATVDIIDLTNDENLQPPNFHIKSGRPRTKRVRRDERHPDDIRQVTCSLCGEKGNHNRQSCTNAPKAHGRAQRRRENNLEITDSEDNSDTIRSLSDSNSANDNNTRLRAADDTELQRLNRAQKKALVDKKERQKDEYLAWLQLTKHPDVFNFPGDESDPLFEIFQRGRDETHGQHALRIQRELAQLNERLLGRGQNTLDFSTGKWKIMLKRQEKKQHQESVKELGKKAGSNTQWSRVTRDSKGKAKQQNQSGNSSDSDDYDRSTVLNLNQCARDKQAKAKTKKTKLTRVVIAPVGTTPMTTF